MKFRILILFLLFNIFQTVEAQTPERWSSTDIHQAIKKLNFLGSALYVAAHPDDENTRMIAYLANHLNAETAYLSLTRGDGGQNLIGTEIQELLGVLRTQELLAARRIDGGKQMFSRANDFGYSKNPDETLKIWYRNEVLSDAVWAIRKFQPDIIINRFSHDSGRRTHGHHTSSAILSVEAFDMVNDKNAFPEQLKYVEPWQPKRLFMNTSWWFYGSREKFAAVDKSKMLSVDVGVYYPMKGLSNTEIAAFSRSEHKCQGMGNTPRRGSQSEYLELIKGEMPTDKENLFDGINTTWTRIEGGMAIQRAVSGIDDTFSYTNPEKHLPAMVRTYNLINALPDSYWKNVKLEEIKEIISKTAAIYAEATADDYSATPGEDVELTLEFINRSNADIQLSNVSYQPMNVDTTFNLKLENNVSNVFYKTVTLPKNMSYTTPYWLNETSKLGMYTVKDQAMRGLPETPRSFKVNYTLEIEGTSINYEMEVAYKKTDPVKGEVHRPFEVLPPVYTNIQDEVIVYAGDEPKTVSVRVKSGKANVKGNLKLNHPKGWKVEPAMKEFTLEIKGEEQVIDFHVFPPDFQSEGTLTTAAEVAGKTYSRELTIIEYDHIPTQTILQEASAKVVKIDLKKEGERVGYIMGAGDKIPESLEQIGYSVDLLEDKDITSTNLQGYDAIIMGIRAYNTIDRLKFHQQKLLDYVENGGTMIVQYNTNRRLKVDMEKLGPYPMKVSRDRVSVEDAPVKLLLPKHPVLNYPNKISLKDFDGWIQERGLYFPNEWDDNYKAILSSYDPGEDPKDGGLLVAKFGKGHYIYSGYSWFRELPAGVPGAYRLFTNMISIGKE